MEKEDLARRLIMSEERLKKCFVIMPISDDESYIPGHFTRVYDYIIKPACLRAGFEPVRADEVRKTNFIVIDILKQIISSEMVICDLSSRNPNVLYELGIRQAFNLPVTLIRDSKTLRIFDIQGLRDIEYDQNLRIDNVNLAIEQIAETLSNTFLAAGTDVNSLIELLGVSPAKITSQTELSNEGSLLLEAINNVSQRIFVLENSLDNKKSFSNQSKAFQGPYFVLENDNQVFGPGDFVEHPRFGKGQIISVMNNGEITVKFASGENKKLVAPYAKLKKLVMD